MKTGVHRIPLGNEAISRSLLEAGCQLYRMVGQRTSSREYNSGRRLFRGIRSGSCP